MSLKQGDVIKLNGTLRVVRSITERQNSNYPVRRMFCFTKLKASWSSRAYTCYSTSDLGHPDKRIELVARNYRPKSEVELRLQQELDTRYHAVSGWVDYEEIRGIT